MMGVAKAAYKCDWCGEEKQYDGEDALDQAAEDGWIVMLREPDKELTFCSADCLISYL